MASLAPSITRSISIPQTAIGNIPIEVKMPYLPPILSGIVNVSYPSISAKDLKSPLSLFVVIYILSLAFSLPYLSSINAFNKLKAIVGSKVVPDLEITFIDTSLSFINSINSAK